MRVRQGFGGVTHSAGIWFNQANQDQAFIGMATDGAVSPPLVGVFGTAAEAFGLVMDTTNGNVGIGTNTTPPASALTIRRDAKSALGPILTLSNGSGGGGAAAAIDFSTYTSFSAMARLEAVDDGNGSNHLLFFTNNEGSTSSSLVERMRIASTGAVGIGTPPSPGSMLDIADRMRVRQGPNGTAGIWLNQPNVSQVGMDQAFVGMVTQGSASRPLMGFWGNTGAQWGLVMDTTNGYVGIGTGTGAPLYPLHVDSYMTQNLQNYWSLTTTNGVQFVGGPTNGAKCSAFFQYRVISSEFDTSSDAREKRVLDHLQPEGALGALRGVDVVRYEWLYRGGLPKWGVLAQQLGPHVPEAVSIMAGQINGERVNDYHTVDFQQLTAVQISAIQALDARTEALRAANAALETKVGALEGRLAQLEGPEAGVCHRGEGRLVGGVATIELPASFEALARPEGRTVQVTPLWDGLSSRCSALAATTVREGQFRVRALDAGDPEQRFYWEVKAVRTDVPPLEVEPLQRT
jgi:hypothetical protein